MQFPFCEHFSIARALALRYSSRPSHVYTSYDLLPICITKGTSGKHSHNTLGNWPPESCQDHHMHGNTLHATLNSHKDCQVSRRTLMARISKHNCPYWFSVLTFYSGQQPYTGKLLGANLTLLFPSACLPIRLLFWRSRSSRLTPHPEIFPHHDFP